MKFTALLPPPPTPKTLILANELRSGLTSAMAYSLTHNCVFRAEKI